MDLRTACSGRPAALAARASASEPALALAAGLPAAGLPAGLPGGGVPAVLGRLARPGLTASSPVLLDALESVGDGR